MSCRAATVAVPRCVLPEEALTARPVTPSIPHNADAAPSCTLLCLGASWLLRGGAAPLPRRLRHPPTAFFTGSKFSLLKLVLAFDTISACFGVSAAVDYSTLPCKTNTYSSQPLRVMFASLLICCSLCPHSILGKTALLLQRRSSFSAALVIL